MKYISFIINFLRYVIWAKEWHLSNRVFTPLSINGIENIELKQHAAILNNAFIIVKPITGEKTARFVLGENSHLNFGSHIVATKEIVIGKNCSISPYVYIADNSHSFEDVSLAPKLQKVKQLNTVEIGDDCWIGRNACVIGCKIGKHCIIGANTVVKKDIPDYCIVAGMPAKIIKRYNIETQKWEKYEC